MNLYMRILAVMHDQLRNNIVYVDKVRVTKREYTTQFHQLP